MSGRVHVHSVVLFTLQIKHPHHPLINLSQFPPPPLNLQLCYRVLPTQSPPDPDERLTREQEKPPTGERLR